MRVAIIGTGQLAQMLADAAQSLEVEIVFLALPGDSTECVDGMADIVNAADFAPVTPGKQDLYEGLGRPDVVTVEKETVPVDLLHYLSNQCSVYPNPDSIATAQNRGKEKDLFTQLGIPTNRYKVINDADSLTEAANQFGYPFIAKALEGGYDGKGQWHVKSEADLSDLLSSFPKEGVILEEKVNFEREVSLIAARSPEGKIAFFPIAENKHIEGVLVTSVAPAKDVPESLVETMKTSMQRLMDHWNYVGVLTIEFFVETANVLVNEIAPRVHNSGHWTMQTNMVSQFENHIRAIAGKDIEITETSIISGMVNILGDYDSNRLPELEKTMSCDLFWYKKTAKPKRKMGHINTQHNDRAQLVENINTIRKHVYINDETFG